MNNDDNQFVERKNNNTILIIIIVIIALALIGLTYYTFFIRDNNKSNDNNNPVVDNNDIIDESPTNNDTNKKPLIFDSNSDTSCWYNGGDTLFNTRKGLFVENPSKEDIVKEAVYKYKIDKTFNDLNDEKWQHYIISRAIVFSQLYQTNQKYKGYSNTIYPEACTDNTSNEKMHMACHLGLTESEMEVADKELFAQNEGGSCTDLIYKLDDIKEYIQNLFGSYGNIFEKSFSYTDKNIYSNIYYDKNIDKIFVHYRSVASVANYYSSRYEISQTNKDNILQIEYLDYTFDGNSLKDENGKVIGTNIKLEEFDISSYANRLPHYQVTFKLVNGNYLFDSIVKK